MKLAGAQADLFLPPRDPLSLPLSLSRPPPLHQLPPLQRGWPSLPLPATPAALPATAPSGIALRPLSRPSGPRRPAGFRRPDSRARYRGRCAAGRPPTERTDPKGLGPGGAEARPRPRGPWDGSLSLSLSLEAGDPGPPPGLGLRGPQTRRIGD